MPTEPSDVNVTWRWLVGVFAGLLILAGGAWATTMQAQVNRIDEKQAKTNDNTSAQAADIAVIKERLRVIEDRQKEQSEQSKETNKKLDDLKDILRGQKR